jgi:UDP-N-acetylmuramoyl-L-alanyl-D-glutamate--2,6-diaminopimelate ligase
VTGITGTNGKTTCAYLTAQALTHCGRPTGYLGTIGWGLPDALAPTSLTTADAVGVQRQLAALAARGARAVAMEVSSHALAQHRVDAVHFHAAAFTHLTRDHLDFHGSMQAYAAAKARLITRGELTARVINIDDAFGLELARRFAGATQSGLMLTGRERDPSAVLPGASFLRARALVCTPQGLSLTLESSFGATVLSVPLVGEFNADNALTVLGLVLAHGVPLERATQALGAVRAAPGRMELFTAPDGALAIVDYAHTPDALAKALRAARQHCRGTLRVVFGCGGDRDRGKRPLMGEAAAGLADQILLTDDNPRSEDPQRIVEDIRAGVPAEVALVVEHDRARAIELALERSRQGDAVLIAGKGHEDYQIYGRERRAFSDQAVVRGLWGQVEGRA